MKTATVAGAGGFIGTHLVNDLKSRGYYVIGIDLKPPSFSKSNADVFIVGDMRNESIVKAFIGVDEYYQLAADMGGAGYIFTGKNDFKVMTNSAQINMNVAKHAEKAGKVFFSSSACVYPEHNQEDEEHPITEESTAYPAKPDSEYGWEKLFSERLYLAARRNKNAKVVIARFHNVYGPKGTFDGGREKAPAALCRKVITANNPGEISIWGEGHQTRSFTYINDCIEGIQKLMALEQEINPVNLGSTEMVSINQLAEMIIQISGKNIKVYYTQGPTGVKGRNSDNNYIKTLLNGWEPNTDLCFGLCRTYEWIKDQINVDR
jgi:nucleoside-diphosphate-sugar epimerase